MKFLRSLIMLRKLINLITMIPVVLSVIMRATVQAQNCFGGVETFEKTSVMDFDGSVHVSGTLLHQENVALTRDCINLCRQQPQCQSFALDYAKFRCSSYAISSKRQGDRLIHAVSTNLFEKVCLNGLSRQTFDSVCGHERLWAFERVKSAFLDGFTEKQVQNVGSKDECEKNCLMETNFVCRSADYDESERICRMSKEDRRSQPQAFRQVQGSHRDYLENQCAAPGPSSCVYRTKPDFSVLSMDSLHFAPNTDDCQMQCDREASFNCRAYSFINNRCVLSGDDGVSLVGTSLPTKKGAMYGERTCVAELCTNGVFTYEKITGFVLRTAVTTAVELPNPGTFGATGFCKESCDAGNLNCPAFSINYQSSRCEKLDRNSQGRTGDLIPREGENYFEKICLRVPQIMSACQDKYWAFERILGYELAPILYEKTLNFVQSRRDCEEYCLQEREFPCRSALYNDETTECKLSKEDRRSMPGMYYRSRNLKMNYLENQCIRSHSTCPYEQTIDAYPTYTDLVETNGVSSHEVCEKYCNENKRFLCRSYAYYSSNGQCFISGDDRASAGNSAIQKRSGIVYFERVCPKLPSTSTLTTSSHSTDSMTNTSVTSSNITDIPTHTTNGNTHTQTTVTKFPTQTSPSSQRPGNGLAPPFEPLAPTRHSTTGQNGPETPRALDNDMQNMHSQDAMQQTPKCGPHNRFLFEKVTSFEPIGGHLTLLYSDLQTPGIVTECAKRCEHSTQCRAFVVDYYHQSCHGLFENSSVGHLDLRLSVGKDYFEGFCVPNHLDCGKYWPFDRILDQASIAAEPMDKIRFISRLECRIRCLEERKFKCLSASYDSMLHECRLYAEDRNSGALTLLFTKGTDYLENQCAIDTKTCRYHSIERDISIVPVTKSVRGTSTFHCEQACDHEKEFNCRSYTYLDSPDGPAPGGNLCLLSSDNRATSHQGSMQFRPRALYAEKDCVFQSGNQRTSRVPSTPFVQPTHPSNLHSVHTQSHQPVISPSATNNQHTNNQHTSNQHTSNQHTSNQHTSNQLTHIPPNCAAHEFTFEKTFGRDFRYARRERAPMPPRLGVLIPCQDECLRRSERCRAFVVEYGILQGCFFLDDAAGENRNQLTKTLNAAYLEKICLREKTCGKVYTFERVIGYTFNETPDKEIPSCTLRSDCQDLCLAEKSFTCKAATFDYNQRICKLFSETRRSRPSSFQPTTDPIDYFENQCVSEPSTCQYRDMQEFFFPYIDRLTSAYSLADCQKQCDGERMFPCRSLNYELYARDCALSSEDMITLGMGPSALMPRRNSLYSEKGNCEQVSVQCNQQDMVLKLNFDSPFYGRVYAKGNPSQCFVVGTGQTQLQFAVSLGSRCGTREEGTSNFANEVVVQQHAVIMTDSDRTIRVLCTFEANDQTVTLSNPAQGKPGGIDVTALMNARTRLEHPITSVVTNTAPPPAVVMRILDRSGQDAQIVGLGDELTLKLELRDPQSAFAIFARNLYARSSNGESLFLIDNAGCPTDPAIFPALQTDMRDQKSLSSTFKAFRFPSTGIVNFEVQIRFCQERCQPVRCASGFDSFGRRRKRNIDDENINIENENLNQTDLLSQDDNLHPIFVPYDEQITEVTKRKIVKSTTPTPIQTTSTNRYVRSPIFDKQNSTEQSEPLPTPQSLRSEMTLSNEQPRVTELQNNTGQDKNLFNQKPHSHEQQQSNYKMIKSGPYYPPNYTIYQSNPSLSPPSQSTTHLPIDYQQQNPFLQNQFNQMNYNPYYSNWNHQRHPFFNYPYNYHGYGHYQPELNQSAFYNQNSFWSNPYAIPNMQLYNQHSPYGNPIVPTPIPTIAQIPPQNHQFYHEIKTTTSRPNLPHAEWKKMHTLRTSRPTKSNKIVSATTLKPQQQEVPLSLAIMVGEDRDSNINWKQNNRLINKPQTRPIKIDQCQDCNPGMTMFLTALIVSLVHISIIVAGYFYIFRHKSLRSKFSTTTFSAEDEIAGINQFTGSLTNLSQSRNANVFYGNREFGIRTNERRNSLNSINFALQK